MALVDGNGDGRVRAPEVLAAEGASRDPGDPYADKASRWPYLLGFLVIIGAAAYVWYRTTNGTMTLPG